MAGLLEVHVTIEGGIVSDMVVPPGVRVVVTDVDLEALGDDPVSVWSHEPETQTAE